MQTIKQFLIRYHKIETELLLATVLKKPKEFLFMEPEYELSSYQVKSLSSLIKRREKGEPVAYILGYKDFMGLRFKVNKDVLVPRPETEELVKRIMKYELGIRNKKSIRILDVGTGSGCIAISLAKQIKVSNDKYQIYAADISKIAIAVAKDNAKLHKVKIKFIHSDILKNIRMKFDVIVANLPYVSADDYERLIKNLKFEPKNALTDGTNNWSIYERFFKETINHLNPDTIIWLEIDPQSKYKLSLYAKKYLPGAKFIFYKDFNRLWRYMEIKIKDSTM